MHEFRVRVGPAAFRVASQWRAPLDQMAALYADYPQPDFTDFTVRLESINLLRRFIRPTIAINGDYMLPDAAPLPFAQGLLAAEMGMNLQMALGWRRHLILHASAVERGGKALIMTGASGSGKSTLSAMLGLKAGWRFMGDEFALVDPATGDFAPYPRMISLKNEAITAMQAAAPSDRFGPMMRGTPKGDIRHLVPQQSAVDRMDEPAKPALLLFPRFGYAPAIRIMPLGETFMRLTQASTNYVAIGEAGFAALTNFVQNTPAFAIDYSSGKEAEALVEQLWGDHA
jgi:HprK-related kinase A